MTGGGRGGEVFGVIFVGLMVRVVCATEVGAIWDGELG